MTGKLMSVACWKCSLKHEYLECSKRMSFADGRKHVCSLIFRLRRVNAHFASTSICHWVSLGVDSQIIPSIGYFAHALIRLSSNAFL